VDRSEENKMKYLACLLLLPMAAAHSGEIYLCKAYSGGMFWASTHCNQHNALIDRIANVPDSLPWDQKVALGEQQRRAAAGLQSPVTTVVTNQPDAAAATRSQCKALDARVVQLDDMARQPQSGPTHDWIRRERQSARDRQFELRC
jgi:hypothetical protein